MGEPAGSRSRTGLLRVWVRSQPGPGGAFGQVCSEGAPCESFGTVPVVELSIHQVALHQMNVLVTGNTFVAESASLFVSEVRGSWGGGPAMVHWGEVLFGRT